MDAKQRKQLAAQANRIKATLAVAESELSDTAVEHVRTAFARRELVKVRVETDDREACERAAARLAERVPCEVVQRVGRVITLYRARADSSGGGG